MAGRTLSGALGLFGDWDLGENNWKDANDLNLLKLSVLVGARVASRVSATPGAPAAGDAHIFKDDHPTEANAVAVYDEGAWVHIAPWDGLHIYSVADKCRYVFTTADGWVRVPNPFRIRPVQSNDYTADLDDADALIPFDPATDKDFTIDDGVFDGAVRLFIRQTAAGAITFVGGAGITLVSRDDAFTTAGEGAVAQAYQEEPGLWAVTGDVTP